MTACPKSEHRAVSVERDHPAQREAPVAAGEPARSAAPSAPLAGIHGLCAGQEARSVAGAGR